MEAEQLAGCCGKVVDEYQQQQQQQQQQVQVEAGREAFAGHAAFLERATSAADEAGQALHVGGMLGRASRLQGYGGAGLRAVHLDAVLLQCCLTAADSVSLRTCWHYAC